MFLKIVNLLESRDVSMCFKFLLILVFVKNKDAILVITWATERSNVNTFRLIMVVVKVNYFL